MSVGGCSKALQYGDTSLEVKRPLRDDASFFSNLVAPQHRWSPGLCEKFLNDDKTHVKKKSFSSSRN